MNTFNNANYAPGVACILSGALAAITPKSSYTPAMPKYDPYKVTLGFALRAAEKIHLADWQIGRLFAEMEALMEEMLDSDAEEVYERYEAYRQAERDERDRMEAESEQNYLAQQELNYELERAIEGGDTYASLAAG